VGERAIAWAKGDGVTDDTEVFRKAIAAHRAVYLSSGYYVINDTLTLRPDTVLIGLHPWPRRSTCSTAPRRSRASGRPSR